MFLLSPLQHKTGLPISTYFSAVKLRWLLDNVHEVGRAVQSKRAMFGTVDSWIIWVRAARRLQPHTGTESQRQTYFALNESLSLTKLH